MNRKNKRYSDAELIEEIKKAHVELGRVPSDSDFRKRIPNSSTFRNRFGSWNSTLEIAGLKKLKFKQSGYTRDELISHLRRYYEEFNKVPTTRELKENKTYPSSSTYENVFGNWKNALVEAGLYDKRKDKNLFDRKEYSKDDVIELVREFIIKYNRVPISTDYSENRELPSQKVVYKHFNTTNDLLILLDYDTVYESLNIRSDEELINDLFNLYIKLGEAPTSRDIDKCSDTASTNAYVNRFGSLYNSLEKANIPHVKKSLAYSDEEIIAMWYVLKNKLKRVPTLVEIEDSDHSIIRNAITWRWNSYSEFLKLLGEDANYNLYGCRIYETSNSTKCSSYLELLITQWLEDTRIEFDKDYPYSKILENDASKRTVDWAIYHNDEVFYIELFGIMNSTKYDANTKKKINDFNRNGINLMELYPKDVDKKNIGGIFSFLGRVAV